jgi:hypothetical protein
MAWYRTGTISLTTGSAVITGSGSQWLVNGTLRPGDVLLAPDGEMYEIFTFESDTHLTLGTPYLGATESGEAYSIMPIGLLPSTLARRVEDVLAAAALGYTGGGGGGTSKPAFFPPRIVSVDSTPNLTLDWSAADVIRVALVGDTVITNTGAVPAQTCLVELTQDAVGGRSVAWTSETVFGDDIDEFAPSATPSIRDRVGLIFDDVSVKYSVIATANGYIV